MPAQLKVSFSANQKLAASCRGEWPQITHWYQNRWVKLQLPVRVLSQSLRNESSAGNWLQLNRLARSSCGVYYWLLFSRDHLLLPPALFPSSLKWRELELFRDQQVLCGRERCLEEDCDHPPPIATRCLPVTQWPQASSLWYPNLHAWSSFSLKPVCYLA